MKTTWRTIANILQNDGVAVIPTDTLYGVVGRAFSKKAVERVYEVKGRDEGKPCIILITSFKDLRKFGIHLKQLAGGEWRVFLRHIWPDKVSVVLPVTDKKFEYLHRGTEGLAFRMVAPSNTYLFRLIEIVGPLVAPSANPQGEAPARTIEEAEKYFGDTVDGYMDGGLLDTPPSTLVSLLGSKPKVLRQGSVDIYKK